MLGPNIKGTYFNTRMMNNSVLASGALAISSASSGGFKYNWSLDTSDTFTLNLNASTYDDTYVDSATLTPKQIPTYVLIKA